MAERHGTNPLLLSAVSALCVLVSALQGPVLRAAAKPLHLAAAAKNAEGKWTPVKMHEALSRGITFQIRYLDPPSARAAIERGLSRPLDLLPGWKSEKRPGFVVFVLQLDNGSEEEILFNPGQSRLATEKGDMKFALDYTALYESSRRLGSAGPTMEEMAEIFFDRVVAIKPGGSVRKLLAFEAPTEDRWKTAQVMILEIQSGPEAVDVTFPFRKFEPAALAAIGGP